MKRKPEFGKYSYEYGFNKNGLLVGIKGVNEFTTPVSHFDEEYLIYNKDIVYSVELTNTRQLDMVSKYTYDNGNIVKYERSLVVLEERADLWFERYHYINKRLSEVSIFQVTPSIELYEEQKYKVELNEERNVVKLIGGFVNNGVWEQDIFNFTK
ncbi:MAG: hypothetical protein ACE3JQ_10035 [Paenisporosarcina sp.]